MELEALKQLFYIKKSIKKCLFVSLDTYKEILLKTIWHARGCFCFKCSDIYVYFLSRLLKIFNIMCDICGDILEVLESCWFLFF